VRFPVARVSNLSRVLSTRDVRFPVARVSNLSRVLSTRDVRFPVARVSNLSRVLSTRDVRFPVAQVSNLLYRRLPVGRPFNVVGSADWKSAIQQVGNLRYD